MFGMNRWNEGFNYQELVWEQSFRLNATCILEAFAL